MLHKNWIFCLLLLVGEVFFTFSWAKPPEFETSWLESTAGAGVGSVLMDESTILNPAPLALFNISSLYFQKTGIDTLPGDHSSLKDVPKTGQKAFIVSDSKEQSSASFSYIETTQASYEQKHFALAFAYPTGQHSALGVGYRMTRNKFNLDGENATQTKHKQIMFGTSYIISPNLSFGVVATNPFKNKQEDSKMTVGLQYIYKNFISFLLDLGSRYTSNFSSFIVYKTALQFKVVSNIFLRVGTFQDKGSKIRGTGVGLGWVQPRLVLNFSMKNSSPYEHIRKLEDNKRDQKTSFSISYRF